MTPPRRETDYAPRQVDDDDTPEKPFDPAELSGVAEMERNVVQRLDTFAQLVTNLQKSQDSLADALQQTRAKAAETSVTLFRAVPKRWRLAAVLGTLLGAGGLGSAGTAWSALEGYKADVAAEALADAEARQLAAATAAHLATPHVDPGAAAKLAETLDRLDRRLAGIEQRLDQLEARRGR